MPSMSGWQVSSVSFRFLYTNPVDTSMSGLAIRINTLSNEGRGVSISPIPSERAVPCIIQYGISAPSFTDSFISSSFAMPRLNISFNAVKHAAASVLPPAIPAATGIFLMRLI